MGARRHHHHVFTLLIGLNGAGSAAGRPREGGRYAWVWLLCTGMLAGCASASTVTSDVTEPPAAQRETPAVLAPAQYTTGQAERGEEVFSGVCSTCHGANEFRGPIFSMTWMAEPVGHLFEHISTNMPEDRPGSLAPEEYVAVLAYFLRENGREPGDEELPTDVERLNRMRW